MLSQKSLQDLRRRVRSFAGLAKSEIGALQNINPSNVVEARHHNHSVNLLTGLVASAEQIGEFLDYILGDASREATDRIERMFEAFHLANAMQGQHGTFLVRFLGGKVTNEDRQWAKDRIAFSEILKPLVAGGQNKPRPTVNTVLSQSTFSESRFDAPKSKLIGKVEEANELLGKVERLLGLQSGSLVGKLAAGPGRAEQTTKSSTRPYSVNAGEIAETVADTVGDDEVAAEQMIRSMIDSNPELTAALERGDAILFTGF